MPNKKRFTSEKQILDAIERCHTKSTALLQEAEIKEQVAKQMIVDAEKMEPKTATGLRETARHKLYQVRKLRKSATSLVETKAKRLGRKLAEFNTVAMPILKDNSIQQ